MQRNAGVKGSVGKAITQSASQTPLPRDQLLLPGSTIGAPSNTAKFEARDCARL